MTKAPPFMAQPRIAEGSPVVFAKRRSCIPRAPGLCCPSPCALTRACGDRVARPQRRRRLRRCRARGHGRICRSTGPPGSCHVERIPRARPLARPRGRAAGTPHGGRPRTAPLGAGRRGALARPAWPAGSRGPGGRALAHALRAARVRRGRGCLRRVGVAPSRPGDPAVGLGRLHLPHGLPGALAAAARDRRADPRAGIHDAGVVSTVGQRRRHVVHGAAAGIAW